MSKLYTTFDVIKLVRDARLPKSVKASQRAVLYALASRLNPEVHKQYICWPSLKELAGDTSQSKRSAQNALSHLESLGLIAREQRWDSTSNIWINVKQLLEHQPRKDERRELPPSPVETLLKEGDEEDVTVPEIAPPPPPPAKEMPQPSPVAEAILSLGTSISEKEALSLAGSLCKSYSGAAILARIRTFGGNQLDKLAQAKNPGAYLRRMIEDALSHDDDDLDDDARGTTQEDDEGGYTPAKVQAGQVDEWIGEILSLVDEKVEAEGGTEAGADGRTVCYCPPDTSRECIDALFERFQALGGGDYLVQRPTKFDRPRDDGEIPFVAVSS